MNKERPVWKDVSGYGQYDTERIPNIWELKLKLISIRVHRNIYNPGAWHLSCYALALNTMILDNKDLESAKKEAVEYLSNLAHSIVQDLEKI